jgi:N-acetyl-gamma-glutamyl-phosphate reductase
VSDRARGSSARNALSQPLAGEPVARVLVAGASGFAGALSAALVWRHPRLELAAITARADAGSRLDRLYPRYRVPLELEELDLERIDEVEAAIVAYPHGAAAPVVEAMRGLGVKVVDLSADFRLRSVPDYERWYGAHDAPELIEDAVYGLTELHRGRIAEAELVANPGCYPTAALLALAPLAEAGLIDDAVVDAKSGVSGAGRGGGDRLHYVHVDENFSPYAIEGHRHEPEIAQELALLASGSDTYAAAPSGERGAPALPLTFVPHLLPLDQGLLASCYVRVERDLDQGALRDLYTERYAGEPFVELVEDPPGVRDVRDTNLCRIHVASGGPRRVLAFAAIDNLWKGASGQAIQNLNLMLGLPESMGLE